MQHFPLKKLHLLSERAMQYSTPFFSIITVSLNSVNYIEDCIKSIIYQDYKNYEYLIIDGGSTDGTVKIIEKYQKYINYWNSEKDKGLSDGFNRGLEKANGQWIIFINSDDYLINSKVLSMVSHHIEKNNFSSEGIDVVFGKVIMVKREDKNIVVSGPHGKKFNFLKQRFTNVIPHQGAFISKNYFKTVGHYSLHFKFAMDYEHFLRKGSKLRVSYIPQTISKMRIGGISTVYIEKTLYEWMLAQIEHSVLNKVLATFLYKLRIQKTRFYMYVNKLNSRL
jgi:glycosyltransferase involved in cell wall biosynthesis